MSKLARCIRLSNAFQRMGTLATRDIMRILEVDRQTAVRDVKSLIEAEVPISLVGTGRERRYILDPSFRRSGVLISQGEAFALHFARQFLGFVEGTALTDWLDQLQTKLKAATPRLTAERQERFARRLVFLSEPYRPYRQLDTALNEVLSALLDVRELSVAYRGRRRHQTWRAVQPLALVVYRRTLYLLARIHDELRRLAVDRIESVERGEPFVYPRDFDPATAFDGVFGVFDDNRPAEEVMLRFTQEVADLVRERVWHPSARLKPCRNGGVVLRMRASGPELARLVLEFGARVEVLRPDWLRLRVAKELRAATAYYDSEPEIPAPWS